MFSLFKLNVLVGLSSFSFAFVPLNFLFNFHFLINKNLLPTGILRYKVDFQSMQLDELDNDCFDLDDY